jgi:hypothetical protein
MLDRLFINDILGLDCRTRRLKDEWELLEWALAGSVIVSRSLRRELSGWHSFPVCFMALLGSYCVAMSYYGIIRVTVTLLDGIFGTLWCIAVLITFIPYLRDSLEDSELLLGLRELLAQQLTEPRTSGQRSRPTLTFRWEVRSRQHLL